MTVPAAAPGQVVIVRDETEDATGRPRWYTREVVKVVAPVTRNGAVRSNGTATAELDNQTLVAEIKRLRRQRNAVILAHNYQIPAIQDLADFVGDSLGLAREAAKTDAEVVVFCGVHFMAETAAILSPEKMVLLPDLRAGCSLADSITADQLRAWKAEHPGAVVVSYVNTSAEVKALTDYCCTSSNAVEIVEGIPEDQEVLFLPDLFLGEFVRRQTGRQNMHVWMGECHVHAGIVAEDVDRVRQEHPDAELLIHPECACGSKSMLDLQAGRLDARRTKILSTGGMIRHAESSTASTFIVATEVGILHQLRSRANGKKFFAARESAICPFMKMITLQNVYEALRDLQHHVTVAPEIAERARLPIDRMVAVGR